MRIEHPIMTVARASQAVKRCLDANEVDRAAAIEEARRALRLAKRAVEQDEGITASQKRMHEETLAQLDRELGRVRSDARSNPD